MKTAEVERQYSWTYRLALRSPRLLSGSRRYALSKPFLLSGRRVFVLGTADVPSGRGRTAPSDRKSVDLGGPVCPAEVKGLRSTELFG